MTRSLYGCRALLMCDARKSVRVSTPLRRNSRLLIYTGVGADESPSFDVCRRNDHRKITRYFAEWRGKERRRNLVASELNLPGVAVMLRRSYFRVCSTARKKSRNIYTYLPVLSEMPKKRGTDARASDYRNRRGRYSRVWFEGTRPMAPLSTPGIRELSSCIILACTLWSARG